MSENKTSPHSSQSSLSIDDESIPESVTRPYQFKPEFYSSKEDVEEGGLQLGEEHQHDDENSPTRNLDW